MVPHKVVQKGSGENTDHPKSEIFISPSSNNIFSGLISLCITFFECKYCVAKIHCLIILLTVYSGNHHRGYFVIVSNNSPSDAYSRI